MPSQIQVDKIQSANGATTYLNNGTLSNLTFPSGHCIKTSEYNIARGTYGSVWFPADDTIPQISEGTEIFSQAYTPSSSATNILIRVLNILLYESSNISEAGCGALFISGTNDAQLVMLGSKVDDGSSIHHSQLSGEVLVSSWSGEKTISVRKGSGHHCVNLFFSGYNSTASSMFGLNTCPAGTVVVQEIA